MKYKIILERAVEYLNNAYGLEVHIINVADAIQISFDPPVYDFLLVFTNSEEKAQQIRNALRYVNKKLVMWQLIQYPHDKLMELHIHDETGGFVP